MCGFMRRRPRDRATTRVALGRTYACLFAVSTAFPVAASLLPAEAVSRAIGILDVVVALALVITGFYLVSVTAAPDDVRADRAVAWYRVTGAVPLVLLVVFFLAGSHVRWDVLLPGLAWRGWLLMYSLPAMLGTLRPPDSKERLS
jgi:hypothetical protein